MSLTLLKSKIHRATVTEADLHYEGSISIDETLLNAADLFPHERVHVWDITNGNRLETYALPAPAGSGMIKMNGAAAHLIKEGDMVIICAFEQMSRQAAKTFHPKVVLVNKDNTIKEVLRGSGGPDEPVDC